MEMTMQDNHNVDPTKVQIIVHSEPIKTSGADRVPAEMLQAQGEAGRANLVYVDYGIGGTCGDERARVGYHGGEKGVEHRGAVFGGPNVYALAIGELTGHFNGNTSGKERLNQVTNEIEAAGLGSGGHKHCAANGGFGKWMRIIAEDPDAIKAYARGQRNEAYDDSAMDEVIAHARAVVESGRYDDWTEHVLVDVLGEDRAAHAIEELADVPHEANTLLRNKVPNTTVDQSSLYERSATGVGSFDHDDSYADVIEAAVVGEDRHALLVAAHAREAILAAVANAVPNPEIYQIDLVPAA